MAQAKSATIEFAQGQRVGDRSPTLQQDLASRRMSLQQAAQQNKDDDKKSRLKPHLAVSRQTPQAGKRLFKVPSVSDFRSGK